MIRSISLKLRVISSLFWVTHFDFKCRYATLDEFVSASHAWLFSMSLNIATNGGSRFFLRPILATVCVPVKSQRGSAGGTLPAFGLLP